jgi:hypothetical protein
MKLSKINQQGFYFRKSNCEWTVPHAPDTFPDNFSFNRFEMETLEIFGSIPSEVKGEITETVVSFTQEDVDKALENISI